MTPHDRTAAEVMRRLLAAEHERIRQQMVADLKQRINPEREPTHPVVSVIALVLAVGFLAWVAGLFERSGGPRVKNEKTRIHAEG